jgi:glyoxylase-like metal-dependent hydrolase (beta-lactamase superfamily II)
MARRRAAVAPEPATDEAAAPEPLVVGVAKALSPLARRILAPNPGVYTGPGTNTYLVGIDEIVVIDPGPADEAHLDAIVGCGGDRIRWIALTHTHADHSPGAAGLKERTGAELLAFGPRDGVKPDRRIEDGDMIEATEFRLTAVHTPGHASNHLCYLLEEERMLFSGDHIMQGSTVVIRPPDGDMAEYLASLEKVRKLRLRSIAPGHGRVITDPARYIDGYLAHRAEREAQILAAVREMGPARIDDLVPVVYADVDEQRRRIARHSMHAHLIKLAADGLVEGKGLTGRWSAMPDQT